MSSSNLFLHPSGFELWLFFVKSVPHNHCLISSKLQFLLTQQHHELNPHYNDHFSNGWSEIRVEKKAGATIAVIPGVGRGERDLSNWNGCDQYQGRVIQRDMRLSLVHLSFSRSWIVRHQICVGMKRWLWKTWRRRRLGCMDLNI